MKLFILALLISTTAYCQNEEKAIKFHVISTEVKVVAQNGGWTEWATIGKMTDQSDENIIINFTNKSIIDDFKLEKDERQFHTYKILNYSFDKSLSDFGVHITTMKVDEGNGKLKDYKLTYSGCKGEYVLVIFSAVTRTRYILNEL